MIQRSPAIKLPKELLKVGNESYEFGVMPQLPGIWDLGPAEVNYRMQDHQFTFHSETIKLEIIRPSVQLKLSLEPECIVEDYEYDLNVIFHSFCWGFW